MLGRWSNANGNISTDVPFGGFCKERLVLRHVRARGPGAACPRVTLRRVYKRGGDEGAAVGMRPQPTRESGRGATGCPLCPLLQALGPGLGWLQGWCLLLRLGIGSKFVFVSSVPRRFSR